MSAVNSKVDRLLSWQKIRSRIAEQKAHLVKAHLIAILATLLSVPIPLLMPLLVDEVLLDKPAMAVDFMQQVLPVEWQQPTGYIFTILLFVVLLRVLSLVVSVLQSREFTIIGKQISLQIRQQLLAHLPRVQLREYETQGAAGISSRCITDVDTLDNFLSETLAKLLISLLSLIGVAAVLLWLNWQLGLFILLLNPVVIYFSRSFGKRVKTLKREENAATEAFQQSLIETLDAVQQLRAAQREPHYFAKVTQAAVSLRDKAVASSWKTDAMNRLSFTVFLVGFEVFRAVAMLMVLISDLTVGQMFAVFGYLWFMMGPVQELLNIQYAYFAANAALKRLNQVLELPEEPQYPSQVDPFTSQATTGFSLENVTFAYPEQPPVLSNISLSVKPGQSTALVSVSGGGKSTLVQLLLGLYQPSEGKICFGGEPIERIGYPLVRDNVATVLQQPMLFNASIRENLGLGRVYSDAQLWQALEIAVLDNVIRNLPEQLDAVVGRNGVRLSGGQRQRLAIARMVLSDPKIVILDEATSALDVETEARLHRNLRAFLRQRTTLIIAHRLSAIQQADQILVLDDGELRQWGEHQQLISQPGLYQTLFGTPLN